MEKSVLKIRDAMGLYFISFFNFQRTMSCHKWVEMWARILAVISKLSLHMDVESVMSLFESIYQASDQNRTVGMTLWQEQLAGDPTISRLVKRDLCHFSMTSEAAAKGKPASGTNAPGKMSNADGDKHQQKYVTTTVNEWEGSEYIECCCCTYN